ncbi:MAG: hypothetical protein AB8B64_11000 [Granulosicoccus sp.]
MKRYLSIDLPCHNEDWYNVSEAVLGNAYREFPLHQEKTNPMRTLADVCQAR